MPPKPLEYQGHAAIAESTRAAPGGARTDPAGAPGERRARVRLLPTRPHAAVERANGLIVLTLAGDKICAITRVGDNSLFPHFGLPRTLRD